jgi:hypothetical protein
MFAIVVGRDSNDRKAYFVYKNFNRIETEMRASMRASMRAKALCGERVVAPA